ncbi:MAG TPA: DUF4864 domain-containing protein [Opitutaceae bacterium]|nr:DUF4864 domain-containing protein [Opitutaceae bacterium]
MRLLLIAIVLAGLPWAAAAESHYSKPEVRKELTGIVESQLADFRREDFAAAYVWAATALQRQFPLKAFTTMIKNGYPLIAHSERAEFGLPMDDGEVATLSVRVFGPRGQYGDYSYQFVHESAGWRIGGVAPDKPRGPAI